MNRKVELNMPTCQISIEPNKHLSIPVLENKTFFILPFVYEVNSSVDSSARREMQRFVEEIDDLPLTTVSRLLGKQFMADCPVTGDGDKIWKRKTDQASADLQPVFKQIIGAQDCAVENRICESFELTNEQYFSNKRNPNISRFFLIPLKSREYLTTIGCLSLMYFYQVSAF